MKTPIGHIDAPASQLLMQGTLDLIIVVIYYSVTIIIA